MATCVHGAAYEVSAGQVPPQNNTKHSETILQALSNMAACKRRCRANVNMPLCERMQKCTPTDAHAHMLAGTLMCSRPSCPPCHTAHHKPDCTCSTGDKAAGESMAAFCVTGSEAVAFAPGAMLPTGML